MQHDRFAVSSTAQKTREAAVTSGSHGPAQTADNSTSQFSGFSAFAIASHGGLLHRIHFDPGVAGGGAGGAGAGAAGGSAAPAPVVLTQEQLDAAINQAAETAVTRYRTQAHNAQQAQQRRQGGSGASGGQQSASSQQQDGGEGGDGGQPQQGARRFASQVEVQVLQERNRRSDDRDKIAAVSSALQRRGLPEERARREARLVLQDNPGITVDQETFEVVHREGDPEMPTDTPIGTWLDAYLTTDPGKEILRALPAKRGASGETLPTGSQASASAAPSPMAKLTYDQIMKSPDAAARDKYRREHPEEWSAKRSEHFNRPRG